MHLRAMCDAATTASSWHARDRIKLLGLHHWLSDHRDEHFGNGRTVRNVFEHAIRRQANRIAGVAPLTHELLTRLEPADIDFENMSKEDWTAAEATTRHLADHVSRLQAHERRRQGVLGPERALQAMRQDVRRRVGHVGGLGEPSWRAEPRKGPGNV